MAIQRWRPFDELFSLRRDMDRVLEGVFGGETMGRGEDWGTWAPPVNVSETGSNYTVTIEAPGVDPKDLEISVQNNTLTIRGEKKRDKEEKDENFHRVERVYGMFTRQISLPTTVANDKISADCRNGVVTITLPKAEAAKRTTVKVNAM